jgi:LysM repeat protein
MNKLSVFILLHFCVVFVGFSQKKITREEYLSSYKDIAIKEMNRTGVPASITLSQGMLESDNGNSRLAVLANNHFGIKCHNGWEGEKHIQDDDTKDECFRKYKNASESFVDHSDFLKNGQRYAFLFQIEKMDYKAWAEGLKKAGYATNPKYPELLIKIIEDNELYKYDTELSVDQANNTGIKLADIDNVFFSIGGREVFMRNKIKCVKVKKGDSFFKIAQDLDLMLWQLYKYNDLDKNSLLAEGQILYIQPKKAKASVQFEKHIVKQGETIRDISQQYGVKINKLLKKNNLSSDYIPKAGDEIWLRNRKN